MTSATDGQEMALTAPCEVSEGIPSMMHLRRRAVAGIAISVGIEDVLANGAPEGGLEIGVVGGKAEVSQEMGTRCVGPFGVTSEHRIALLRNRISDEEINADY